MADTPLFYIQNPLVDGQVLELPDETARHIGQVLRMQAGEAILLTDGKGTMASCQLEMVGKKRSTASIQHVEKQAPSHPQIHLAIAFTKNVARNEWLLEKATELGVSIITPLVTERSIRERIKPERWNAILVSAMLQSKQVFLPLLGTSIKFETACHQGFGHKVIAHCMEGDLQKLPINQAMKKGEDTQLFIGPEGDFSPAELILAKDAGMLPISLGTNRLRTETAALAAITHFYLINHAS